MANTILHKRSSTASAVPAAGTLSVGELAINTADVALFTKKVDNSVVNIVTSNKLSSFASTTSAEFASVISDETGSGKVVFSTSPTFTTSVVTNSTIFDVFNNTATTIYAFGAATNLDIGYGGTDNSTTNICTGSNGVNKTKTINLGTGGGSNSSTDIIIGPSNGSCTITLNGNTSITNTRSLTVSGDLGVNGGDITTSATTASLYPNTATTINIGGAATTVNLGAAGTSTVNVAHNLIVSNKLEATTKSFVIDHPTKSDKKLRYACLEGPENAVYARGRLNEQNVIELPEYWINLIHEDSITVNLTSIGESGCHRVKEIKDNRITIDCVDGPVNCFYIVFAERKDVEKLVTEF